MIKIDDAGKPYAMIFSYLAARRHLPTSFVRLPVVRDSQAILRATALAHAFHAGQRRKTGEPYASHPLATAWLLVFAGVTNEDVLSAALLHDVLEDCSHLADPATLLEQYAVTPLTVTLVMALTKRKGGDDPAYWRAIAQDPRAIVVKLADRLHNILTLENAFPLDKQQMKILETKTSVLSLVQAPSLRTSSLFPPSLTLCRAIAILLDALSPSPPVRHLKAQVG